MGIMRHHKMEDIMSSVTNAIYPIGMMLLIIGGGGTFKQVLIDGVGDTIAKMFTHVTYITCLDCCSSVAYCTWFSNSCAVSTTGIVLPLPIIQM